MIIHEVNENYACSKDYLEPTSFFSLTTTSVAMLLHWGILGSFTELHVDFWTIVPIGRVNSIASSIPCEDPVASTTTSKLCMIQNNLSLATDICPQEDQYLSKMSVLHSTQQEGIWQYLDRTKFFSCLRHGTLETEAKDPYRCRCQTEEELSFKMLHTCTTPHCVIRNGRSDWVLNCALLDFQKTVDLSAWCDVLRPIR